MKRLGAGLVVAVALLGACSDGDAKTATPTSQSPSTIPPETTTTYPMAWEPPMAQTLPDGKYEVLIAGADPAARTIDVDLVDRLSHPEADNAYHVENPQDEGGPPNDYYILNNEVGAWRVKVADNARLLVIRSATSGFEAVPGSLTDLTDPEQWFCDIVVRGGMVVELTEYYRP